MDFIHFEATNESQQNKPLEFSYDEKTNVEAGFIDDSEQPMEDVSFYRKLDPENIDHYNKFPNLIPGLLCMKTMKCFLVLKTHNLNCMICKIEKLLNLISLREKSKKYYEKGKCYKRFVKKFMETFTNFKNSENPFFVSII